MNEAILKQFEVLWAEIGRRSNAQQALVAATVTASGSIGGLRVTGKGTPDLLLVLAFVAPTFGLLWLDHARTILKISKFIAAQWRLRPNWEKEREEGDSDKPRHVIFIVAVTIIFLGPAVVGLAGAPPFGAGAAFLLAWAGGLVLTAMFAWGWGIHAYECWPESEAKPKRQG